MEAHPPRRMQTAIGYSFTKNPMSMDCIIPAARSFADPRK